MARNSIRHKQSKYFTIMLIPDSSLKVKSIKIPHWAFYAGGAVLTLALCITLGFKLNADYEKGRVTHYQQLLEESSEEFSDIIESKEAIIKDKDEELIKKDNIQSTLEQEKMSLINEKTSIEQQIGSYEQRIDELKGQLNELEEIKSEIYDMISSRYSSGGMKFAAYDGDNVVAVSNLPMSAPIGGPTLFGETSDPVAVMLDLLEEQINAEFKEWEYIAESAKKAKAIKSALPSGWPLVGKITSYYGYRQNPFSPKKREYHKGIDIKASTGTAVKATADGKVTFAGVRSGYGYFITISHDYGYQTNYAHNSKLMVSVGDYVSKGETIALSGNTGYSTGPHLHYEVLINGVNKNPWDFMN